MSQFTQVKALRPGRNVFDLSYEKKFDFDVGQLIPAFLQECVPGGTYKIGNELVINAQPLNAPIYHKLDATVHYFFVPTRLIFDGWEDFITGGVDGKNATVLPRLKYYGNDYTRTQAYGPFSLYDYFGFPVIFDSNINDYNAPGMDSSNSSANAYYFFRPLAFPWRIYNLCYNEFYRDETLQSEVDLDQPLVLNRNWAKDYFTSSLPFQQRGTSPALPLSGTAPVIFSSGPAEIPAGALYGNTDSASTPDPTDVGWNETGATLPISARGRSAVVSFNNAATFDVSDLRLAFQLQKFMERAARGGVRYTEFLTSFFGVSPTDARLQRPEYLGGSKSPVLINQVTQTSESGTTPQGTLRGKGITADKNYICKYTASEFGYIIGILSVLPMPSYQQGVERTWLRKVKSDFYFPMFAHLSEQAVFEEEVYALPGNQIESGIRNGSVFGYQAPYNEMRQRQNKVCGSLRDSLSYWHMGRIFDSVPSLNSDFITCDATRDHLKRVYAVQNVPGLICNFANIVTGILPIPKYGEPGLIDHS